MKYEKRHRAYKPTMGALSIPAENLINDLKERATDYIGTFSEFNPIGFSNQLAVVVRKETCTHYPQRDFKLSGFKLKSGLRYHGSEFNNNYGIKFSKQDLSRIVDEMDTTDELHIIIPDFIDKDFFEDQINIVTNGHK